eukprot:TRINITY_DN3071_c0_g1_i3.p1 TRINITY_DN3071_c0_g1~~TRINITY_DN3071_c0_g1_i3.p1  ORF type:complete len:469 (+),score=74.42 TRINITY_DN3071_c0_g1_i3:162-1568(+)
MGALLSGNIFGGVYSFAFFLFNHGQAQRGATHAPPLRESFAMPIFFIQIFTVSLYLKYTHDVKKKSSINNNNTNQNGIDNPSTNPIGAINNVETPSNLDVNNINLDVPTTITKIEKLLLILIFISTSLLITSWQLGVYLVFVEVLSLVYIYSWDSYLLSKIDVFRIFTSFLASPMYFAIWNSLFIAPSFSIFSLIYSIIQECMGNLPFFFIIVSMIVIHVDFIPSFGHFIRDVRRQQYKPQASQHGIDIADSNINSNSNNNISEKLTLTKFMGLRLRCQIKSAAVLVAMLLFAFIIFKYGVSLVLSSDNQDDGHIFQLLISKMFGTVGYSNDDSGEKYYTTQLYLSQQAYLSMDMLTIVQLIISSFIPTTSVISLMLFYRVITQPGNESAQTHSSSLISIIDVVGQRFPRVNSCLLFNLVNFWMFQLVSMLFISRLKIISIPYGCIIASMIFSTLVGKIFVQLLSKSP